MKKIKLVLIVLFALQTAGIFADSSNTKSSQSVVQQVVSEKEEEAKRERAAQQIYQRAKRAQLEAKLIQQRNQERDQVNQVVSVKKYSLESKEDVSLANVKRGRIKLKIANNYIPNELEIRNIAIDALEKYRGVWQEGIVFFYVKNMPINDIAYASVDFNHSTLGKITVMPFALELSEIKK